MKRVILFPLVLVLFKIASAFAEEVVTLEDKSKLYAFRGEPPIEVEQRCMNGYAFLKKNGRYEIADNGIRRSLGGTQFLVRAGCILPHTGSLELDSGKFADFYQEYVFSEKGELAFWAGKVRPLPDGNYRLKTGTEFSVKRGHLANYGAVCGEDICFENRD